MREELGEQLARFQVLCLGEGGESETVRGSQLRGT